MLKRDPRRVFEIPSGNVWVIRINLFRLATVWRKNGCMCLRTNTICQKSESADVFFLDFADWNRYLHVLLLIFPTIPVSFTSKKMRLTWYHSENGSRERRNSVAKWWHAKWMKLNATFAKSLCRILFLNIFETFCQSDEDELRLVRVKIRHSFPSQILRAGRSVK